jgi:putative Holliday junction resolvase
VASGNRLTRTATPVTTVFASRGEPPWDDIDRLLREWQPECLVVGMPSPGNNAEVRAAIADFVQELGNRYKLPVHTVDETLTSRAAEAQLAAARRSGVRTRRTRKGDVDRHAACLIAERWMAETDHNG